MSELREALHAALDHEFNGATSVGRIATHQRLRTALDAALASELEDERWDDLVTPIEDELLALFPDGGRDRIAAARIAGVVWRRLADRLAATPALDVLFHAIEDAADKDGLISVERVAEIFDQVEAPPGGVNHA